MLRFVEGHLRPNWAFGAMSGLPALATELRTSLVVQFVLKLEVFNGLVQVPLAQWMSAVRSLTATTARLRHARLSNIWSPAGRSTTCICYYSPHHRGLHICPRNLRLDPHIAPRMSLLLPVS